MTIELESKGKKPVTGEEPKIEIVLQCLAAAICIGPESLEMSKFNLSKRKASSKRLKKPTKERG